MDQGDEYEAQISVPEKMTRFSLGCANVNELLFLSQDVVASASSNGDVSLLRIGRGQYDSGYSLEQIRLWSNLHSSCNGLSCSGENMMTAGSDGRMTQVNAKRQEPVRIFANTDGSCCYNACLFLKQDSVIGANNRGQIKLWDLRSKDEQPSKVCNLSIDLVGTTCLDKHPTQPHVLVAGGSDGSVAFWDLRGTQNYPLSIVRAHSSAVSEVSTPATVLGQCQKNNLFYYNPSRYISMINNQTTFSRAPNLETSGIGTGAECPKVPTWTWPMAGSPRQHQLSHPGAFGLTPSPSRTEWTRGPCWPNSPYRLTVFARLGAPS